MRIGSGFDVHAFGDGDHVTLGGWHWVISVRIFHPATNVGATPTAGSFCVMRRC